MNSEDVFINCPFSSDYDRHFKAVLFTVIRCGFNPRCAREDDDSGRVRFEKICDIIAESKYGIHDISKTELDAGSQLPRFNMPLELGLFLGARKFGGPDQKRKKTIIFDRDEFRYQQFISDIAGQDIHAHQGQVESMIVQIAAWLRRESRRTTVPGGMVIAEEFERFTWTLPSMLAEKRLNPADLTYDDDITFIAEWIFQENQ
jgi:hypothetical protein